LINAHDGTTDEAQWIDAGDPSMTLSDLQQQFLDEFNGNLVMDDPIGTIPEPSSLALLGLGAFGHAWRAAAGDVIDSNWRSMTGKPIRPQWTKCVWVGPMTVQFLHSRLFGGGIQDAFWVIWWN